MNRLTRHHRKPKYLGGDNTPTNISLVKGKRHEAYHLLFRHGNPFEIAKELNNVWIDPAYRVVIERK